MRALRRQSDHHAEQLDLQLPSDIGGIEDVYDGFDFDVNARLARNILLSGGVSLGRERINNCVLDQRSQSHVRFRATNIVLATSGLTTTATSGRRSSRRSRDKSPIRCHGGTSGCLRHSRACRARSSAPTTR